MEKAEAELPSSNPSEKNRKRRHNSENSSHESRRRSKLSSSSESSSSSSSSSSDTVPSSVHHQREHKSRRKPSQDRRQLHHRTGRDRDPRRPSSHDRHLHRPSSRDRDTRRHHRSPDRRYPHRDLHHHRWSRDRDQRRSSPPAKYRREYDRLGNSDRHHHADRRRSPLRRRSPERAYGGSGWQHRRPFRDHRRRKSTRKRRNKPKHCQWWRPNDWKETERNYRSSRMGDDGPSTSKSVFTPIDCRDESEIEYSRRPGRPPSGDGKDARLKRRSPAGHNESQSSDHHRESRRSKFESRRPRHDTDSSLEPSLERQSAQVESKLEVPMELDNDKDATPLKDDAQKHGEETNSENFDLVGLEMVKNGGEGSNSIAGDDTCTPSPDDGSYFAITADGAVLEVVDELETVHNDDHSEEIRDDQPEFINDEDGHSKSDTSDGLSKLLIGDEVKEPQLSIVSNGDVKAQPSAQPSVFTDEVVELLFRNRPPPFFIRQWSSLGLINRKFQSAIVSAWQEERDGTLSRFIDESGIDHRVDFERRDILTRLLKFLALRSPRLESMSSFSLFVPYLNKRQVQPLLSLRYLKRLDICDCTIQAKELSDFLSKCECRGVLEELRLNAAIRFLNLCAVDEHAGHEIRRMNDQFLSVAFDDDDNSDKEDKRVPLRLKSFTFDRNNAAGGKFFDHINTSRLEYVCVERSNVDDRYLQNLLERSKKTGAK